MKVVLRNGGVATSTDIEQLEAVVGPLPQFYTDFVSAFDGANADPKIFRVGDRNDSGVNAFIKIRDIKRESARIENLDQAFPIAYAEGGNFVLIDPAKDGAVQFWDHERPDERTTIAPNFEAFLELLEPFDIRSVKLEPGQVQSAWIDPDFLQGLQ